MVGACVEELALELAKAISERLSVLSRPAKPKLRSFSIKAVLDEISSVLGLALDKAITASKDQGSRKLREAFEHYWLPMTHMIRVSRNNAGHPGSIDPVTWEDVHSSLLIFPHVAKIADELTKWVAGSQL